MEAMPGAVEDRSPDNYGVFPDSRDIVSIRVDVLTYGNATERVLNWARNQESRYVCVANVHMVMEAADDPDFRRVVNGADLVTADGMPLVWMLRLLGVKGAERVYGPQLMRTICEAASRAAIPVSLIGSTESVLTLLQQNLARDYPELQVAFVWSPPFGADPEETSRRLGELSRTWGGVVFVALGCPKQERWMNQHRGAIKGPMVGVGAAFDFLAGTKGQAPRFMARFGMEWLYRMLTEPRRLWRRYAYHNPRFLVRAAAQLVKAPRQG